MLRYTEGWASVELDQDEEAAADRVMWNAPRAAIGYPHEAALTT